MSLGIWPSEASMNKTVSKFNQLPPDFFKNTDNSTAYIRYSYQYMLYTLH
jgi:hypothetical protein